MILKHTIDNFQGKINYILISTKIGDEYDHKIKLDYEPTKLTEFVTVSKVRDVTKEIGTKFDKYKKRNEIKLKKNKDLTRIITEIKGK